MEIFFLGDAKIVTDLFGDAVTLPSGRRGRPAHRWSKEAADRVILGCAMGYTPSEIAEGLGVSLPTLRKYYFSELKMRDMHRTRSELWMAQRLAEQANQGNVGALKELRRTFEVRDRILAERKLRNETTEEPIGKKEEARRAANAAADSDPLLQPGFDSLH